MGMEKTGRTAACGGKRPGMDMGPGAAAAPEISIIVPVYNTEKYLDRCIRSIVRQTFADFELILVDDGSPDACPQMCDMWAGRDSRIRVCHKENGGLSSARNAGLAAARGNYIGFVDSDDWIAADMYAHLYELIRANGADIASGRIRRVRRRGREEAGEEERGGKREAQIWRKGRGERKGGGRGERVSTAVYSQEEFAEQFFKIHSNETVHYVVNKLYQRDTVMRMRFPKGLINEDVEGFFKALAGAERIAVSDKTVYYYWENTEGISYQWFSHKQMDLLAVWRRVCGICRKEKPEWLPYAQLNYARANLGLLCRLALADRRRNREYREERELLLKNLRKCRRKLLRSPIPLSRKIAAQMMCMSYGLTRCLLRLVQRCTRACLKIHSWHLHAPLRGIFGPNSLNAARCAAFIWPKSPTKWHAQLPESNFQTRSSGSYQKFA